MGVQMLKIVEDIIKRTINISKDYSFLSGKEELFREIILEEFSNINEGNGIKIMDAASDYTTDDGIFVYFSNPIKVLNVKNSEAKKKIISERKAVEIISLSYVGRQLSLTPQNTKEEMTEISKQLSLLLE